MGRAAGKGDLQAAILSYQEAYRLQAGGGAVLYALNLGMALQAGGEVDRALGLYRMVVRVKPELAEAHYQLGTAWQAKQEPDKAIVAYQEAIRLRPDYADAYAALGASYQMKGDSDQALVNLQRATHLHTVAALIHYKSGMKSLVNGKPRKAGIAFAEFLRLISDNPDTHDKIVTARNMLRELTVSSQKDTP
ncbi:MAG: tetratricopeptide repeat protein [Nitrospira sp.]|nr:tetratricopeptide repeat protein [Nitrospira sp.]